MFIVLQIIMLTHNSIEGHNCVLMEFECIFTCVIMFPIICTFSQTIALFKKLAYIWAYN